MGRQGVLAASHSCTAASRSLSALEGVSKGLEGGTEMRRGKECLPKCGYESRCHNVELAQFDWGLRDNVQCLGIVLWDAQVGRRHQLAFDSHYSRV